MPASVRSWRGEKHTTRQVPRSPSARNSPSPTRRVRGVRTERREVVGEHERRRVVRVDVARGAGVAGAQVAVRVVAGRSSGGSGSSAPSQGRFVRPADTSTHSPVSALRRRCGSASSAATRASSGRCGCDRHGSGLLQAIRRAPSDAATSNTRGVSPVRAWVVAHDRLAEGGHRVSADEVDRAAAEPGASEPRADDAGHLARDLDQRVQLRGELIPNRSRIEAWLA